MYIDECLMYVLLFVFFLSLVKFVFLYFSFLSTIAWLNKDLYFLAAGKLSPTTTSAIDTARANPHSRGVNSTQLNSTNHPKRKEWFTRGKKL